MDKNELIEQYAECNDGLIVVNGDELERGEEYYMDEWETCNMIRESFSTEDSILHLTHNNMSCKYIEAYRKSDGHNIGTDAFWIDEKNIINIILPLKANDKYKQWFETVTKFIKRTSKNGCKSEDITIICHDDKAQTWDAMDLFLMRQGESYTNCTIDYCDYERYDDTDIVNLTEKIIDNWGDVKEKIEDIINRRNYGYAYKMNGFCMVIEQ